MQRLEGHRLRPDVKDITCSEILDFIPMCKGEGIGPQDNNNSDLCFGKMSLQIECRTDRSDRWKRMIREEAVNLQ